MWHTDWHVMKDFRVRDLNLITYLDDASRCITGYGVFKEATGLNAVKVLRQAILAFGAPASILSDNGSCFGGVRSGTPKGTWTPTVFEVTIQVPPIEATPTRFDPDQIKRNKHFDNIFGNYIQ